MNGVERYGHDVRGSGFHPGPAYPGLPGGLRGEGGVHGAELGQRVGVQVALVERDRDAGEVLSLG